jgi:hypothetical protein
LRLPGGLGQGLAKSLLMYQYLLKERDSLKGQAIVQGIDRLLIKIENILELEEKNPPQVSYHDTPAGLIVTVLIGLCHWLLLLL